MHECNARPISDATLLSASGEMRKESFNQVGRAPLSAVSVAMGVADEGAGACDSEGGGCEAEVGVDGISAEEASERRMRDPIDAYGSSGLVPVGCEGEEPWREQP